MGSLKPKAKLYILEICRDLRKILCFTMKNTKKKKNLKPNKKQNKTKKTPHNLRMKQDGVFRFKSTISLVQRAVNIDRYIICYSKFLLQAYLSCSIYEEEKKGEVRIFPSSAISLSFSII